MRVYMAPEPESLSAQVPSGIVSVIQNYAQFAPYYKIEFVSDPEDADVVAVHAGTPVILDNPKPTVAHCHGLYWTADNKPEQWEYRVNKDVIRSLVTADAITVPSEWVAQTLRRDMHLNPVVLPHGVDFRVWSPHPAETPYILWNKNRASDACDPTPVQYLSERFPDNYFLSTYAANPSRVRPNLRITGTVPQDEMHAMIEGAYLYLATTKETFGIGTLEALASGVPVLGFNYGGTQDIVQHGINGYLAIPGDYEDLSTGLLYCIANRPQLSANALLRAKDFKWNAVMRKLKETYELAIARFNAPHSVSVVIPCFNKQETIGRAIRSVVSQTFKPHQLSIILNNCTDNSEAEAEALRQEVEAVGVNYIVTNCPTQGVAHARNWGCGLSDSRYFCCLDGDDEIEPGFLEVCVNALRGDSSVGVAYTRLVYVDNDQNLPQKWPNEYNFDKFLVRQNQVPTCAVFRSDLWRRLGGYRQRYAPDGAGAEDAEFWLRIGANGYKGKLVTEEPLFRYHSGGQVSTDKTYMEEDWLYWHPWIKDYQHPFASCATPFRGLPSHPVRAYDTPLISVIIPCSYSHLHFLLDALDSLEAQTLRQWEGIVVFDFVPLEGERESLLEIYPYLKIISVPDRSLGPGACRNLGVLSASASLVTFLDADDWLEPGCLFALLMAYRENGNFSYTDYYGHAHVPPATAQQAEAAGRLKAYYRKREEAITIHHALDYDCDRALKQPEEGDNSRFYIWNVVTTLVTKEAHLAIGGFDEKMMSYEDWDYWLRMARAGYCFIHITEPLVNYRFHTGSRRETGRQNHDTLIDYLRAKYKGDSPMPCRGCKGGRTKAPMPATTMMPAAFGQRLSTVGQERTSKMSADEMVTVKLNDGNIGEHPIVIRDPKTQESRNYGYRREGEEFLMHRHIAAMYPQKYIVQEAKASEAAPAAVPTKPSTPPPPAIAKIPTMEKANGASSEQATAETPSPTPPPPPPQPEPDPNPVPPPVDGGQDWREWGMTELQASKLVEVGIVTVGKLAAIGVDGLHDLTGMSLNVAKGYIDRANGE